MPAAHPARSWPASGRCAPVRVEQRDDDGHVGAADAGGDVGTQQARHSGDGHCGGLGGWAGGGMGLGVLGRSVGCMQDRAAARQPAATPCTTCAAAAASHPPAASPMAATPTVASCVPRATNTTAPATQPPSMPLFSQFLPAQGWVVGAKSPHVGGTGPSVHSRPFHCLEPPASAGCCRPQAQSPARTARRRRALHAPQMLSGLELSKPCSLPNATAEPVRVTAPMKVPWRGWVGGWMVQRECSTGCTYCTCPGWPHKKCRVRLGAAPAQLRGRKAAVARTRMVVVMCTPSISRGSAWEQGKRKQGSGQQGQGASGKGQALAGEGAAAAARLTPTLEASRAGQATARPGLAAAGRTHLPPGRRKWRCTQRPGPPASGRQPPGGGEGEGRREGWEGCLRGGGVRSHGEEVAEPPTLRPTLGPKPATTTTLSHPPSAGGR